MTDNKKQRDAEEMCKTEDTSLVRAGGGVACPPEKSLVETSKQATIIRRTGRFEKLNEALKCVYSVQDGTRYTKITVPVESKGICAFWLLTVVDTWWRFVAFADIVPVYNVH